MFRSHRVATYWLGWTGSLILFVGGFLFAHFQCLLYHCSSGVVLNQSMEVFSSNCQMICPQRDSFIITSHSSGRLGNRMSEYASMVAMGALMGYTPVMSQRLQEPLLPIFPNIPYYSSCPLSTECMTELMSVNPANPNQLKQALNRSTAALKDIKGIKLVRNPHITELFSLVSGVLQAHFAFESNLVTAVQTWLLRRQLELRSQNIWSPLWIGIHVRRTDYGEFLSRRNASLVDLDYFQRAIRKMKTIILTTGNGTEQDVSQMVFVVASDDPEWCIQQFSRIPSERFLFTNSHIHRAEIEPYSPTSFDLCVLSHCNHSIYDYGTFAFWGAYLAGGFVVAALDQTQEGRMTTDVMRSDRGANISRWHFLPAHLPISNASKESSMKLSRSQL